jgi:hypothetical protein
MVTVSIKPSSKSLPKPNLPESSSDEGSEPVTADELLRRYDSDRRIAQRYLDEHEWPHPK